MQTIWHELQSPAWWLSAVVVAFLINVLSAYFKPLCDAQLSRISTSLKAHIDARNQRHLEEIAALVRHPHRKITLLFYAIQLEIMSAVMIILSASFAILARFETDYSKWLMNFVPQYVTIISWFLFSRRALQLFKTARQADEAMERIQAEQNNSAK